MYQRDGLFYERVLAFYTGSGCGAMGKALGLSNEGSRVRFPAEYGGVRKCIRPHKNDPVP